MLPVRCEYDHDQFWVLFLLFVPELRGNPLFSPPACEGCTNVSTPSKRTNDEWSASDFIPLSRFQECVLYLAYV